MRPLKTSVLLLLSGLLPITLPAQKDEVPKGWHLLDKAATGYYGISLNEAYAYAKEKKLKIKPVIVAVIGTGIDTSHEDLVSVLWKNPKEIPGNGIDDDHNGYTDDIYGWNFLGSKDGRENVIQDSNEDLRIYHALKQKWDGKEATALLTGEEAYEYAMWKKAEHTLFAAAKESTDELSFLKRSLDKCRINDSILRKAMDKEVFTGTDLDEFLPNSEEVETAKRSFYGVLAQNDALQSTNEEFLTGFSQYIENEERKITLTIAPPPPYRDAIVKDNYNDITDRFYGNNNVMVNSRAALHGTLISGIIAASRTNGRGADGVTNNVKIMLIRATNDGDEHDKDIALAIRYAVDNGAQIINMAFCKMFSSEKKWVDDAVKYAESRNVLIIHAAGNNSANCDLVPAYPVPLLKDGTRVHNWITTGSSGDPKLGGLVASFTNYGKNEVDLFAPGIKIYTTAPGNSYQSFQGTSTSASIVAGVAAFLLQYYPNLDVVQLKRILVQSAQKYTDLVKKPGTEELVLFSELSSSGGIINALEAIKLAGTVKGNRKSLLKK